MRRNPLHVIGAHYTWEDFRCYRNHLRLPFGYLRNIFDNHPRLSEAVNTLGQIIRGTNETDWRERMDAATLEEKFWKVANIPPMYFPEVQVLTQKAADQESYDWLCTRIEDAKGETFYFYSEFCEGALAAAVRLMKNAIARKMRSCFCISFPELLEEKSESMESGNTEVIRRVHAEVLVVIYGVGSEYQTDFKTRLLQEVVMLRKVNNLVTILCSSLDSRDYQVRYATRPAWIDIGFRDGVARKSLAQLAKELGK